MRTIKFRGKSLETGEWVKGSYVDVTKYPYIVVEQGTSPIYCHRVDPETVGQFIEILDNHKNEIYEDDVVGFMPYVVENGTETKHYKKGIIEYDPNDARFVVAFDDVDKRGLVKWLCGRDFEILGDIHDSPELLEGV